jgi:hypothetical protein
MVVLWGINDVFFQSYREHLLETALQTLTTPGNKNDVYEDKKTDITDVSTYVHLLFENVVTDVHTVFNSNQACSKWLTRCCSSGDNVFIFRQLRRGRSLVDCRGGRRVSLVVRRRIIG